MNDPKSPKQLMHESIDEIKMDGTDRPFLFLSFTEEGNPINFVHGHPAQLVPILYNMLGQCLFAQPTATPPPELAQEVAPVEAPSLLTDPRPSITGRN